MQGTVKYGKELKWKDIKIGEAFYFKGCQGFGIKITNNKFIDIAWTNSSGVHDFVSNFTWYGDIGDFIYYSIPKSLRKCLEVL